MQKLIIILAMLFLTGCTSVYRQPVVQPFVDAEYWVLRAPMQYEVGDSGQYIIVPRGFVTDFASTPPALRPLFPKLGRYIVAAIVHDYLYWNQTCTRQQADRIFEMAMEKAKVDSIRRNLMWVAVSGFGDQAWAENAKKKAEGLVKVIPDNDLNIPEDMMWEEYLQVLQYRKVKDGDIGNDFSNVCEIVDDVLE